MLLTEQDFRELRRGRAEILMEHKYIQRFRKGNHWRYVYKQPGPTRFPLIFSGENYKKNLEVWGKGTHNALYVTGLSGSGKSTLAYRIAEAHPLPVTFISLDDIWQSQIDTDKNRAKWEALNDTERAQAWHTLLQEVTKDKKELFVVEGIQLIDTPFWLSEPHIIMNTSLTQSTWRAIKRELRQVTQWPQKVLDRYKLTKEESGTTSGKLKFLYQWLPEWYKYYKHQNQALSQVFESNRSEMSTYNSSGIILNKLSHKQLVGNLHNLKGVPHIRQKNPYTCGAAVVYSALYYFGKESHYTQDKVAKILGASPANGVDPESMVSFLRRKGLPAEITTDLSLPELVTLNADDNTLVILMYQAWGEKKDYQNAWEDGHYSILMGFDKKHIYLQDPSLTDGIGYMLKDEFLSRWHEYHKATRNTLSNAAIIVRGKERNSDPVFNHIG